MASGIPLAKFFGLLKRSHLLTAEQWEQTRDILVASDNQWSGAQLAVWLVNRDWLTRWQAERLLAGQHMFFLGKYKLLRHLGAGGMGTVFQAEQTTIGRIVAIKVMRPRMMSDPLAMVRFQREIEAIARMRHSNIVEAYDADRVGNTHFLVMEFLQGMDLEYWVKRLGRLPIPAACSCCAQAAAGLDHAHQWGMVHRDIKPANLIACRDGQGPLIVKILDMGLARFADFVTDATRSSDLTKSGQVVGTIDYLAPEQARRGHAIDHRADIYSLGCTLFRLLTGRLPFPGDTNMERLVARFLEDPPRLREYLPEAPAQLELILSRLMAREPDQRIQTAAQAFEALMPFTGEAVANTVTTTVDPSPSSEATVEMENRAADPQKPKRQSWIEEILAPPVERPPDNLDASAVHGFEDFHNGFRQPTARRTCYRVVESHGADHPETLERRYVFGFDTCQHGVGDWFAGAK